MYLLANMHISIINNYYNALLWVLPEIDPAVQVQVVHWAMIPRNIVGE